VNPADKKRCFWCGRMRYLLPMNMFAEGVCGACSEDDGYTNHVARMEREERRKTKKKPSTT